MSVRSAGHEPNQVRDHDLTSARRVNRADFAEEVRRLSLLSPGRSLAAIALQWLVITLTIASAVAIDRWYAWIAAALIVATRQHALGVLAHEGAHYRLFENRIVNDVVSDVFCALPLGFTT